jgi:hypothetical protein
MQKFNHPEYDAELVLPDLDDVTVRQVLDYDSIIDFNVGDKSYVRLWRAADAFPWDIEGKDAEGLKGMPLDAVPNLKALEIIKWVCRAVWSYRRELDNIEKNS